MTGLHPVCRFTVFPLSSMTRTVRSALLVLVLAASAWLAACTTPGAPSAPTLATVPKVDLDRYVGRWHELARAPNWFQRNCATDVTAEYARRTDGTVAVVNSCRRADGSVDRVEGTARIVDPATNAKLEVAFAPEALRWISAVWGNYWVIELAPDYRYAIVGEPSREYLWVLSRTPTLDDATWASIDARIAAAGYDRSKVTRTPVAAR
jgi:apolipoprotein D and lipocalin family protein